ncbi:MAG TPA: Omp28-related outer membrane protein [Ignavibacteria bacterium]|nr:Omp28-related outer membrane protein [Ignavibacteria bacterium]
MLTKIFKYIFLIALAAVFTSCESNDGIVPKGTSDLRANSKVLVESFTNTSCVGCPAADNYLKRIDELLGVTINDTNVIIIETHSTMFPNDPFYNFNAPANNARQTYYGAGSINPMGFLMGALMPLPFEQQGWTSSINQRLNKTNTFGINVVSNIDTISRQLGLTLQIGQFTGSAVSDLKLHVALTESDLHYAAPNGLSVFDNVLRGLLTPIGGESITVNPGQSITLAKTYDIDSHVVLSNCKVVIYIQSESTKEIFAVEKVNL